MYMYALSPSMFHIRYNHGVGKQYHKWAFVSKDPLTSVKCLLFGLVSTTHVIERLITHSKYLTKEMVTNGN